MNRRAQSGHLEIPMKIQMGNSALSATFRSTTHRGNIIKRNKILACLVDFFLSCIKSIFRKLYGYMKTKQYIYGHLQPDRPQLRPHRSQTTIEDSESLMFKINLSNEGTPT